MPRNFKTSNSEQFEPHFLFPCMQLNSFLQDQWRVQKFGGPVLIEFHLKNKLLIRIMAKD